MSRAAASRRLRAASLAVAGRPRRRAARLLLAATVVLLACRGDPPPQPVRDWPASGTVAAALAAGEEHRYRLPLPANQFFRLTVDQQGIDAVVELHAPGGELLLRVDGLTSEQGRERLLAVTGEAGDYRLVVSAGDDVPAGRYTARLDAPRPAGDRERALAAAFRDHTEVATFSGGGPDRIARLSQVVETWQHLGEGELEGEARLWRARLLYLDHDYRAAADDCRAAAALFAAAGDGEWEAAARTSLGTSLLPLARTAEAVEELHRAIERMAGREPSYVVTRALQALGQAHRQQGDLQQALDAYQAALPRWPPGDPGRPLTLHALGVLQARFLGDVEDGRALLEEARDAWPMPSGATYRASSVDQLGLLELGEGRPEAARRDFEESLALRRDAGPCRRALTLARLALAQAQQDEPQAARARLDEAVADVAPAACALSRPTVLETAGRAWQAVGDARRALAAFRGCDGLFADQRADSGRIECLGGIARAERSLGRRDEALAASATALELVEGVRPRLLRDDQRRSLFAANQDLYDFHVGLLLELGRDEEAWVAAERARARSLRDLLAEAPAGDDGSAAAGSALPGAAATPDLAARERSLQRQLNAAEEGRQRLAERDPEEAERLARRVGELIDELEALRGERRRHDPLAAVSGTPSLAELRRQLDGDELLLELRLADEGSTLWMVDREALTAVRLPARGEIEAVAREAARWQRSLRWPRHNPRPLCELSRMLLGPVAARLGDRPLILVPDGALETLSFAALPDPAAAGDCADAPPLVARHDLSYLPSAATLVEQRQRLAGRRRADGWLAVVADPVYGTSDPRVPDRIRGTDRGDEAASGGELRRLRFSGDEATALVAGLPPGRTFTARGLDASRQTVLSGALAGHRIVHFATHGVLDAERPLWLSRLALSRLDAAGRRVAGDLYAYEIYRLDLPAELVVLSACDTAAGRYQRGEGLVAGLPRAFLHAGAARVVVSLWAVDDRSGRDLMVRFYDGVVHRGVAPARALREAQVALWRAGRPPREWAGFVLQGDPRPLPPFE